MNRTPSNRQVSLPSSQQVEAELKRSNYSKRYKKTLKSTVYTLIVTAAIVVLIAFLLFPVFRIYGSSMAPTVSEGEVVVALRNSKFDTGDIVVISYSNKLLVKRVIAGPGQSVDIDADGNVSVDGVLINEPYLQEKAYGDCNIELPYQVPDGRYFVMGDNRATSQDSRSTAVGCVAEDQIVGRALVRIWPFEKLGLIEAE